MIYEDVLEAIEHGNFDTDLVKMQTAVAARLSRVRRLKSNKDFKPGDRVRLNDQCGTRYLVGQNATVRELKNTKLVIELDHALGRFDRGYDIEGKPRPALVTVPPVLLDII